MAENDKYFKIYEEWLNNSEGWMKEDLLSLKKLDKTEFKKELMERFSVTADFGTGGLRNIIRSGLNGINDFWIRRICTGMSKEAKQVVIAYDTRHKSKHFAKIAAKTLSKNGCTVFLFDEAVPTPVLSYAVKEKFCDAGIVITASHNPSIYNGFKVYDKNGVQYTPEKVEKLKSTFERIPFINIEKATVEERPGEVMIIGKEFYKGYFSTIFRELDEFYSEEYNNPISVVYSPLYGTGAGFVPEIMRHYNVDVLTVEEQMEPDGNFPLLKVPNPESPDCFKRALEISEKADRKPEILLATDPDADRLGVFVFDGTNYVVMNGNELGMLLLDFIFSNKATINKETAVLKTIVTTEMVKTYTKQNNLLCFETLTGFKYLGEKVIELRKKGIETLFSFEESFGYLYGDHAGDKDACSTSGLLALMLKKYNSGKALLKQLHFLRKKYGFFKESLCTFAGEGLEGKKKMDDFINYLRQTDPSTIWNRKAKLKDYNNEIGELKANVLEFSFDDYEKVIFRPSGTEPKIKAYLSVNDKNSHISDQKILSLEKEVNSLFQRI